MAVSGLGGLGGPDGGGRVQDQPGGARGGVGGRCAQAQALVKVQVEDT